MKPNLHQHPLLRKLARWLLFGLLSLATLIVLAYSALSFWGRREWANAQAELRAKGEKLSLIELMPPPISDEDNFFAAPIWREVMDLKQKTDRDGTVIWAPKTDASQWRINAFRNAFGSRPGINGPSIISKLGGSYARGVPRNLDAAATFCRDQKLAPEGLSSTDTILTALDSAKIELQELGAAARRPDARTPLQGENFVRMAIPHVGPCLSIAQYLNIRIAAEAAEGNGVEAQSHLFLILRIADALDSDPFLISQLVRYSVLSIVSSSVWDGLEAQCWDNTQIAVIQQRLEQINISENFVRVLRNERGITNQQLEFYTHEGGKDQLNKDWAFITNSSDNEKSGWRKWIPSSFNIYPRGLLFSTLAIHNRLIQQMIEQAESGDFSLSLGKELKAEIAKIRRPPQSFFYPIIPLVVDSVISAQNRAAWVEVSLRQAQIACALERYRLTKGNYPESLEELVPAYFAALPKDEIDGENFRYRREAPDQFVLWSIGANRSDEGGTPPVRLNHLEEGDWVWQTAK